ncbi:MULTISPECIES: hypothetical protein [Pseudonocardia]|uniref:Uncharacterized protein n=2 Tax=Pseudonocardia TaxID=1847 RepID=A0A1Y2N0H1_PSEAH|nr:MULTISPECIES: hypothetical protein [Pseudonocardia]OSY40930.1 hypothetical protein BG845_02269 [Pseudonocardia autotrophica]TDN73940.1 hypothetical protein C8E95_3052 [Pseudonocardia autotrophica]BBG04694.1 hypothetical protein Pdca_59030 [Pseudonocardia autotrophica]GEC28765.1 hypothetical protein PSA01_57940 [Pseudonocardia saturnea]
MSAPVIRIPSPRRPVGTTEAAAPRALPEGQVRYLDLAHRLDVPAPRHGGADRSPAADTRRLPAPRSATPVRQPVERPGTRGADRQRPAGRGAGTPPPPAQRSGTPPPPARRSTTPPPPAQGSAAPAAGDRAGRHRVTGGTAARVFTVLARLGSLTTLAAMVVLAAAVAGLADGDPPTGPAAEVAGSTLR